MSTNPNATPLGTTLATPTLGMIIARIESNGNLQAMRFEPTVHERAEVTLFSDKIIANIRSIHNCTYETACVIYSSSYGQYQIMGNVLYDPGFIDTKITVFSYCGNTDIARAVQDSAFTTFVEKRGINFPVRGLLDISERQRFALRYNGSIDYADNIAASLAHFGVTDSVFATSGVTA